MNSIYIIDFCILAAAIYLLVVGIGMKKSGKIHKSVMGEELIKNCVDERAFIDAIYPWMIVFSIASLGLFLIVFFLFIFQYRRALKKYFKDM